MAVLTAPERISTPTSTTTPWKSQAQGERADQVHGQAADQVVQELGPRGIGDDHPREKGDQRGEEHAVDEDHPAGAFQVLELGMGDFAVDLGQGFEAAHGEQRVAEADHDGDGGDGGATVPLSQPNGIVGEADVCRVRERHGLVAVFAE